MQGISYAVDLVLVIDLTASMGPVLEMVKKHAVGFHDDVREALAKKDKQIDQLRVKVLGYRDFFVDGDRSIEESEFFTMPDESAKFASVIDGLRPDGGGDEPESGLEALALAMRSPWTSDGMRQRQVIVVWTDASTHPLEKGASASLSNYPSGLPTNLDELTDDWHGQSYMSATGKRLVLFTPDSTGWSDISAHWPHVVHFPSQAGHGLADVDYSVILDTIAHSV